MTSFTIALVMHNESHSLEACLQSFFKLNYQGPVELLIVDNASSDDSLEKARRILKQSPFPFEIIERKENHLGEARADAIHKAKNHWVAFADADIRVPENWLTRFHEEIREGLVAIGGGNRPPETRPFYRALRISFQSFLGNLNSAQATDFRENRHVDHIPTCNIAYLREAVLAAGNFSRDHAFVSEDVELNLRLRKNGGQILWLKDHFVMHEFSPSWRDWIKKLFRYANGNWQVIAKHPSHFSLRLALPLFFALGLLALPLLPHAKWVFLAYLILLLAQALILAVKNRQLALSGHIFGLFLFSHCAYALGSLWGALRLFRR